jgi:hypothetical protein
MGGEWNLWDFTPARTRGGVRGIVLAGGVVEGRSIQCATVEKFIVPRGAYFVVGGRSSRCQRSDSEEFLNATWRGSSVQVDCVGKKLTEAPENSEGTFSLLLKGDPASVCVCVMLLYEEGARKERGRRERELVESAEY